MTMHWLEEQGLYDPKTKKLNEEKMKCVVRIHESIIKSGTHGRDSGLDSFHPL
ncbi:hypothetical protein [Pueribacillus theae]|uniref:hypothetical protein n=1 Tax=Pueribacillus theae TaxID=2171751 RepID=UPI00140414AB|nr:hypothetical protein [Pueribacillus theae]